MRTSNAIFNIIIIIILIKYENSMAAAAEDRLRMCENVEEVTHQQLRIFLYEEMMMMMMRGAHPVPTGESAQTKKIFFFKFLISPFGIWGEKKKCIVSVNSLYGNIYYLRCILVEKAAGQLRVHCTNSSTRPAFLTPQSPANTKTLKNEKDMMKNRSKAHTSLMKPRKTNSSSSDETKTQTRSSENNPY
jgi:hypothetical protein